MERNESEREAGSDAEVSAHSSNYLDSEVVRRVLDVRTRMYGRNGEEYRFKLNGSALISLEKLIDLLLSTDQEPYQIRRNRDGTTYGIPTKMASYFRQFSSFTRLHSDLYYYPPDFEFFFRMLQKHPIHAYSFVDWDLQDDLEVRRRSHNHVSIEYVMIAHDFVRTFREGAIKENLKKAMGDWRRGPKENKKYLAKRLTEILQSHSRIVVIDLIFLYHKSACKDRLDAQARGFRLFERHISDHQAYMEYVDEMEDTTVPDHMVGLDELKEHLGKFFNNKRHNKLFGKDKFIDYFGRIEFGEEAGFHVHICFLFKGAQMQGNSATYYSHEIGKYWMKVTEGKGYYTSLNARADAGAYRGREGIGVVNHDDFEKIAHMWTALSYFVKADQVVRVKHKKRSQMFLHGKPRVQAMTKRGRPRESGISDEGYAEQLAKIFT